MRHSHPRQQSRQMERMIHCGHPPRIRAMARQRGKIVLALTPNLLS